MDIWNDAGVNIEDVFTHLEIDIERSPTSELLGIRQALLSLIQTLLITLEGKVSDRSGEYHELVNKLGQTDTLITYNWDLLLDNAMNRTILLERLYRERVDRSSNPVSFGPYMSFVADFTAVREWFGLRQSRLRDPYHHWRPDKGFYLKLHGSADWFYCQNTTCRAFGLVFPLLRPLESKCCADCHERLDVLIVPPVLNKDYRKNALVRRVWNVAALEIATAEELLVWGYSLPPTDFHSTWLFRQAREGPLKKLVLINPSEGYFSRFVDMFRGRTVKISAYRNYHDFINGNPVYDELKGSPGSPRFRQQSSRSQ